MKPLISIVVLAYNQEHTISNTLDSILNQNTTYLYEVVIGEDCSMDGTRSVCERYAAKYPDKVHLMAAEENKGLMRNYRDCIAICQGKYLAVCAGDDWWHHPAKLEMQADFLEINPDYGLVYTDFDMYNKISGTTIKSVYSSTKRELPSGDVYADLLRANFVVAGTVMYRKSTFDYNVNLDKFIELGFLMEDYPALLTISLISKFKYLNVSTFSYTLAQGSICNSGTDIERKDHFERNVMDVKKYFYRLNPVKGLSNRVFQIEYFKTMLYQCMLYQKRELAKKNACQLLKLEPSIKNLAKLMVSAIPYVFNKYHQNIQNQ